MAAKKTSKMIRFRADADANPGMWIALGVFAPITATGYVCKLRKRFDPTQYEFEFSFDHNLATIKGRRKVAA